MEKVMEIELADGTKQAVTLRRILRKEKRLINSLIAPKEINTQAKDVTVNTEKWEEYREKYLSLTIKSPESLKDVAALQELPDMEFNALFVAAQELNGEIGQEATEKK
jgi:phosphoribosyl-dephospho-CoA transferase